MQSFVWYYQRLKTMSFMEIVWRIKSKFLDWLDSYQISQKKFPSVDEAIPLTDRNRWKPLFRVSDLQIGVWARNNISRVERAWYAGLINSADEIVNHKLSYFHLLSHDHGNPIQWNKDHGHNVISPLHLATKIDYRDFRETGDCKLVWEPNRHQHLVVLARAWRASGNDKYALEIKEQINSWLEQCPYGYGMNWRSPMELSIRLINWVWSIDLTWESAIFSGAFRESLLHYTYLHLIDITRKYSTGSSANNHLIGEAGGVFIATSYFPQLKNAAKWQNESFEILCREIELQTFTDGANKELALEYQYFVIQFFLLCGLVGKWCGKHFPERYWNNLKRQLLFIGRIHEGRCKFVLYGDADDGYVLNLGDHHTDPRPLLGAGALLFGCSQLKSLAPEYLQSIHWMFGTSGRERYMAIDAANPGLSIRSHAFKESGFYLLRHKSLTPPGTISVRFDCGQLGFGKIAAHGHADALSFTLTAFDEDILIDPGTYDYFTYPKWREYFKSTLAHNTIEVDSENQSVMQGLFLWGERATAKCLDWRPSNNGGLVTGEHDGYRRLVDPLLHRRTLQLDGDHQLLKITDELEAKGHHTIRLAFHFSPTCTVERINKTDLRILFNNGTAVLKLDKSLIAELYYGNLDPILGWASNGYHRKCPCPVVVASTTIHGDANLNCSISLFIDQGNLSNSS